MRKMPSWRLDRAPNPHRQPRVDGWLRLAFRCHGTAESCGDGGDGLAALQASAPARPARTPIAPGPAVPDFSEPGERSRPIETPGRDPHAGPMMKRPRSDLPGTAQHVVQRSDPRTPSFPDVGDRLTYLERLRQACIRHRCALHAYVLMEHHVHLLLTPSAPGAVSRLMQTLGCGDVGPSSQRDRSTPVMWEGRHTAFPVESEASLLACQRNIELKPVRSWIVSEPDAYRWSSHGANAYDDEDPRLNPHPGYLALGPTPDARRAAYRALFRHGGPAAGVAPCHAHEERRHAPGADALKSRRVPEAERSIGMQWTRRQHLQALVAARSASMQVSAGKGPAR